MSEGPMSEAPRLEMRGIRKRFGATVALDGVSLSVGAGEVHALVGQNGAGKSTLMKVLSGAHSADDGEMLLDGERYAPRNPLEGRKRGVAMIYQELSLAPHLTVAENVLLGMEPAGGGILKWGEMKARARAALGALGYGGLDVTRGVMGLSPATQQIIEIARALAIGCRVLVLDEPTSSLTQQDVGAMFEVIRRLKGQGKAIVYISHFLEEVRTIADGFTVLRDGKTVGGGDAKTTSARNIVELMVGRNVEQLYPRSMRQRGEAVLEVRNVSGRTKPADASVVLHRGEVLGIAGLIGAGRTELLRAVFGLDRLIAGEVRVATNEGRRFDLTQPRAMWEAGVGMLSEDRKTEGLALGMSIADNLTMSDLERVGSAGFVWPGRQRAEATRWARALEVKCRDVGQAVGDLSGGNQQKVAIARLLHHDVDVLLLDEPTRGIDVGSKAAIYRLIDELAAEGKGVLVVSSYFPELLGICDRIAVMSRGVLGPAKEVGAWTEHGLVLAATGQGMSEIAEAT
jgi:ribose transport system ATP-binding protein